MWIVAILIKNVHYKAVDTNSCCRAKMYQDIERYGEIIFIEVSLSESGQKKTLFYSNLPVNEEYEQDKKEQCFKCKKGYGKKSLIEYCGEWVCPECLYSILLKEIRINIRYTKKLLCAKLNVGWQPYTSKHKGGR